MFPLLIHCVIMDSSNTDFMLIYSRYSSHHQEVQCLLEKICKKKTTAVLGAVDLLQGRRVGLEEEERHSLKKISQWR